MTTLSTKIEPLRISCDAMDTAVDHTLWHGERDEFGGTNWTARERGLEREEWTCLVSTPAWMWGDPADVHHEIVSALKGHVRRLHLVS